MALNFATPNPHYETFAVTNAESIWNHSRDASNAFGQVWSGPFDAENAGSQSSALDAFVAHIRSRTGNRSADARLSFGAPAMAGAHRALVCA